MQLSTVHLTSTKDFYTNGDSSYKITTTDNGGYFNVVIDVDSSFRGRRLTCSFDYNLQSEFIRANLIQFNSGTELGRVYVLGSPSNNDTLIVSNILSENCTTVSLRIFIPELENILLIDNIEMHFQ